MTHTDQMRGASDGPAEGRATSTAASAARPPWITLSNGASAAEEHRPLRTGRIILQVMAAAAVVVVLVSILGAIASRNVAEREAINDAANTTDLLADAVVQPVLQDGLLTLDPAAVSALDEVIRTHVLGPTIVRVKVWTADGLVVYSDEPQAIGQTFELDAEERDVLANPMTRAEVSDLNRPENVFETGDDRLLEVYRPVWTPSGEPLLFETYSPYDTVTARTGELWRGFAGITLTSLLLLVVLLLPVLWRLLDRLRSAQTQRELLLQHAVDASAEERQRIAASLHDGVVQDLAASSFAVAGAAEQAESLGHPALATQLRGAVATVRASIGGLRSLLVDIYPPSLRTAGLATALDDLATTLRSRQVAVELDVPGDVAARLDADGERLVFRVAQECLRNVVRHSGARHVVVALERQDADVVLHVDDDGSGFDVHAVMGDPEPGHFGLRILSDLAAGAGATLQVASAPGEGTRWRLAVPTG